MVQCLITDNLINKIKFKNGVAKIGNPSLASSMTSYANTYPDAQLDYELFKNIKNNFKSLNDAGYMTVRDTSLIFYYVQTDVIWVFEPKNNLKYFIKLFEVHGFILFLNYSLKFFWYAFLLLNIFGIYWFLMEML